MKKQVLAETWADKMQKVLESPFSFDFMPQMPELIESYEKLSSRQWKKRKELESLIVWRAVRDYQKPIKK